MPTNNWREAFNKFEDDREYHLFEVDKKDYLAFIETQIKIAKAEMKAQCLAVIPEDRNSHDDYADKFYNMALRHSRNSISSL